jgi:hypothetical protein
VDKGVTVIIKVTSSLIPTSREKRYKLWYLGQPVASIRTQPVTLEVLQIFGGPGLQPFIVRGGRWLDTILSQGIEDLVAEPL